MLSFFWPYSFSCSGNKSGMMKFKGNWLFWLLAFILFYLFKGAKGTLTFVDKAKEFKVEGASGYAVGSSLVDADNDNRIDIFSAGYRSENKLFMNSGSSSGELSFTEELNGLGGSEDARGATFGDRRPLGLKVGCEMEKDG